MAPHGVYPCAGDDRWVAIAIDSDSAWQALRRATQDAHWTLDARLATLPGRLAALEAIDDGLRAWTSQQDATKLADALQALGIMAAPVQDGRDLFHDPQLRARGFLEPVTHAPCSGIGRRAVIGRPWRLSEAPLSIPSPAPLLGEHNREVLSHLLQLTDAEIEELRTKGVLGDDLPAGKNLRPLPLEAMRHNHRIGRHDPAYRDGQEPPT
jgi:crotonobetainyl-CoA:carnitine CoA-transferase CaiB-like acyl-CoA transferase